MAREHGNLTAKGDELMESFFRFLSRISPWSGVRLFPALNRAELLPSAVRDERGTALVTRSTFKGDFGWTLSSFCPHKRISV